MSITTALLLCLVLHLTGLVLMAGMSVADTLAFGNFWKQYALDKERGIILFNASAGYQRLMGAGAGLLLVTGIIMMFLTNGAFGEQLWMKIKLGIVVLILINGPIVGRVQMLKLRKMIEDNNPASASPNKLLKTKSSINFLSALNLIFLASIIILSVFKFN